MEGEEVDRDDPLLIATVRARLTREEKAKKPVSRKTVKRVVDLVGDEEKEEEEEQQAVPRRYQREAFEEALRKNTILCLETGGGKTLVAVLLIKALANRTRVAGDKRIIVFLAPTRILMQQQARVVRIHTDLKVVEYDGDTLDKPDGVKVDKWGGEKWRNDISDVEVMMMTPQILVNNLQHAFMKMDMIELLIFDECHHAQKHHAYAQIMKGYYHINIENGRLPKIFGMTASPGTRKVVKNSSDAAVQLSDLEMLLDAEVFTLKDREEVESVAPTASTVEQLYDLPDPKICAPYEQKMEALLKKYETANLEALSNVKVGFKDQADLIDKFREKIKKLHRDLQFCLKELGLWCAYKEAEYAFNVETGSNDFEGLGDARHCLKRNRDTFLKEALDALQSALPEGWHTAPSAEELRDAMNRGYLTPKVYELVVILFQKRLQKDVRCIIFVERRTSARVIANLVNHLECLSEFLHARSICGANAGIATTRGQQQSTVAEFNQGQVNLLVATDVAEEGIDVQTCSEVIRFNLPKTLRSNIQSRGRARRHGSTYIVFLERDNLSQKDQFSRILESEPVLNKEVISRENVHLNSSSNLASLPPLDSYRVEKTGASLTTETSINLINRFCGKLPGDKFYTPKPEFRVQEVGSQFRCDLKLPHPSPISEVKGELQSSLQLAKQTTALEACRQLHKEGALNDHLLPSVDYELDDEEAKKFSKLAKTFGLGTTQQKELYPVQEAEALSGTWLTRGSDAHLHAYRLSFDLDPAEDELHASFVLLTRDALDDDVASLEIHLVLTRERKVTAKLSPLGTTTLGAHQLGDAKIFQQVLFNGMFSKMSKSALESRKRKRGSGITALFLDREDLWKADNAYLLLPAAFEKTSSSVPIDWRSVEATSSAVKSLENENEDEEICPPPKKICSILTSLSELFSPRQENGITKLQRQEKCLTFAGNRQVSVSQVADVAVLTRHTMMIYPVLQVLTDTTALSQFPVADFKSYAEFFRSKYGITLKWPNQPLLQLKQNHRAHNLLPTDPGKSGDVKRKEEKKTGALVKKLVAPKASASVEMPPELCLKLGFPAAVIRSAYWIPSVMHRIKAAVLASQLRRSIHAPRIPVMEVLKALTTMRCNENFNMEALELFGDSFLKYAVSRKLFLELKTVNEGVLSTRRMHRICNRSLHQLAVERGLPGYIRDCQIDPSRWVAPGMLLSREVTCRCKEKQMFKPFIPTTAKVVGVFKSELLKDRVQTETIKPKIGLTCDKGHRYLCSKTVADVMEALIGAYLGLGSNCEGALKFMIWAGIDVDYDPKLMKLASEESPVDLSYDYGMDVKALENRIGYSFKNKYLLLEAMTHTSNMAGDRVRCYQRLEFLGDAVLDFLLTRHLFTSYPTSTPGLLTSLRSASVNNERFARVAVKLKLHSYLRHGSGLLLHQIGKFAEAFEFASADQKNSSFGLNGIEAPKVLGDLLESIAGAVLVDTCFDIDKVWAVMRPLLEPIVTPETLDLHPVTDLEELCASKKYNIKLYNQQSKSGGTTTVKYEVHISDELCVDGISCQVKKKTAKKDAAWKVLLKLKTEGFKEKFGRRIRRKDTEEMASPGPEEKMEDTTSNICTEKLEEVAAEMLPDIIPATKIIENEEKHGSVVRIIETDAEEKRTTTTEITSSSCTVSGTTAKETTVMKESIKVTRQVEARRRQGEGVVVLPGNVKESLKATRQVKDFFALPDNVLQNVQHNVKGSVKVTRQVDDLVKKGVKEKAVEDHVQEKVVEDLVQLMSSTVDSKRRFEAEEDGTRAASKVSKFYWSQDVAVEIASSPSSELHSKRPNCDKPTEDAMDLLTFCPWTGPLSSAVAVKPVPMMSPKTPTKTSPKAEKNAPPSPPQINCRQILNEVIMKNKWNSRPTYKLMNDATKVHLRRYRFSLTMDIGKEKYESQGEEKSDKKQGQESAAAAMLAILRKNGIISATVGLSP